MRHWYECLGHPERDPVKLRYHRDTGRFTAHPDLLLTLFSDRPARRAGGWRESFGLASPACGARHRARRSSPA